jgi:hypothetical protein
MKQRKLVIMKLVVSLFVGTLLVFGCSGTSKEVRETDGYAAYRWNKYIENQPKKDIKPIEVQDVDKVRFSICDIYNTASDMTVAYNQKVTNSVEYHSWLNMTEDKSNEERDNLWKNELGPPDREAVLAFNEANEETYAQASSMLPKALELYKSISELDFKEVSKSAGMNVFKAKSMMSGLNDSKDQIEYTVEVLKLMAEEYNRYQRFKAEG